MKKIIFGIIMACVAFFAGCDWLNSTVNNPNAEKYATNVGKAVAIVVKTSDKLLSDKDIKNKFVVSLDEVIAKLPKDVSTSNVVNHIQTIAQSKIVEGVTDESKKKMYSTVVSTVYPLIGKGLELVVSKYADEFATAEKTYGIVVAFLNSARAQFNDVLAATSTDDKEFNEILIEVQKKLGATIRSPISIKNIVSPTNK